MSAKDTIEGILQRPLTKAPEEVITIDQEDQQTAYTELTEYVVTEPIRGAYRRILSAIAEAPADPPEAVGVWVSGFFGSGKSSFAKNLGYAIENKQVLGHYAGELLMKQVNEPTSRALLESVHQRIPTEVVMFDVNLDRSEAGQARPLSISHYLYRNLLRHLDYSDVPEVAELEFTLEEQGELPRFVEHFEARIREEWEHERERYRDALADENWRWAFRRDKTDALALASSRLHELLPKHYPTSDHFLKSRQAVDVTPKFLVDRSFGMMAMRRPDRALMFVVDEVGGYVARSVDRIEDLRVVVEHFGKVSRNKLKAKEIKGPTWIVVTSQEKLGAFVDYLDTKRVEIARLQDRFPARLRVDLEPSDIQEVVSRRVLSKTSEGEAALRTLFAERGPEIADRLRLERTHRDSTLDAQRLTRSYPYPPHFLGLSIEVMTNLRLQDRAGNNTTAGGSNRTLIRQAYAMLTSPPRDGTPAMKDLPVGRLVTLDRVCDLVWSNLSSEQKTEIQGVQERFPSAQWPTRVAKALCLLQQVRDLPRTEANLAAMLWDGVDHPSAIDAVRGALKALHDADFVRLADDGWTLQNRTEKSWSEKRRGIDPRPGERAERLRTAVRTLFEEAALSRYVYKNFRTLKLGVTMDDHDLTSGQLPLHLITATSDKALQGADGLLTKTWTRSQESASRATAFWVWMRTPRVDEVLVKLLQSEMLKKDEEPKAYGPSADTEVRALIAEEERQIARLKGELDMAVREALARGTGIFRTAQHPSSELGADLATALGVWFETVVPQLYPHLEVGAKPLKGNEAEEALKSASLTGLPEVFYAPPKGLDLVTQKDQRWVVNAEAPVAKLVLAYLREKHGYGTKVTGKNLEAEFTGVGYAWDVELLQLVLALLLRAGHVEMVHQGVRFHATLASDPRARAPFTSKPAFKAASFAPRTTPGTKVLVKAASQCEALTGDEVDIEESAIATAFQKIVRAERERVAPALAVARALQLPIAQELTEQDEWWRNVEHGPSDDTVKLLAEEGAALVERRQRLAKLVDALRPDRVAIVTRARTAAEGLAGEVLARASEPAVGEAAQAIGAALATGAWVDEPQHLADLTATIEIRHAALRAQVAEDVGRRRAEAVQGLRSLPDWERVPEGRRGAILSLLESAAATPSSLDALDAAARAVSGRVTALQEEVLRAARPERSTVRLRILSEPRVLNGPEDVEEFVSRLRNRLLAALGEDGSTAVLLE